MIIIISNFPEFLYISIDRIYIFRRRMNIHVMKFGVNVPNCLKLVAQEFNFSQSNYHILNILNIRITRKIIKNFNREFILSNDNTINYYCANVQQIIT